MLRLLSLLSLLALSFGLTKEKKDWTSYLDESEKYLVGACAAGATSTATAWWAAVFVPTAAAAPCAALAAKKLLFDTDPAKYYEYFMKDKKKSR